PLQHEPLVPDEERRPSPTETLLALGQLPGDRPDVVPGSHVPLSTGSRRERKHKAGAGPAVGPLAASNGRSHGVRDHYEKPGEAGETATKRREGRTEPLRKGGKGVRNRYQFARWATRSGASPT